MRPPACDVSRPIPGYFLCHAGYRDPEEVSTTRDHIDGVPDNIYRLIFTMSFLAVGVVGFPEIFRPAPPALSCVGVEWH